MRHNRPDPLAAPRAFGMALLAAPLSWLIVAAPLSLIACSGEAQAPECGKAIGIPCQFVGTVAPADRAKYAAPTSAFDKWCANGTKRPCTVTDKRCPAGGDWHVTHCHEPEGDPWYIRTELGGKTVRSGISDHADPKRPWRSREPLFELNGAHVIPRWDGVDPIRKWTDEDPSKILQEVEDARQACIKAVERLEHHGYAVTLRQSLGGADRTYWQDGGPCPRGKLSASKTETTTLEPVK